MKPKSNLMTYVLIGIMVLIIAAIAGTYTFWSKYLPNKTKVEENTTSGPVAVEKDSITLGVGAAFTTSIYPDIVADFYALNMSSHFMEPLITFDRENKLTPKLAERWDNPDNLTWRFYLNPNAKFSDGTDVTADDVKFTYDYIQKNNQDLAGVLPTLDSITVIDNKTIEFKTATANPLLLNRLAMNFLIMSKADVEANGTKNHIGSGPYKLASMDETDIKLVRNENYWGEKAKIANVTFHKIEATSEAAEGVLSGTYDFGPYSSADDESYEKVIAGEKAGQIQTVEIDDPTAYYITLDSTRDKTPGIDSAQNPLKDVRVRKAIYEAIDPNQLVEATKGAVTPIEQLVTRGIFGYNPTIKRLDFNVADAKRLMAEAGYANGFTLTIDKIDNPDGDIYTTAVFDQLAAINITVKTKIVTPTVYMDDIVKRNTSLYQNGWSADSMDSGEVLETLLHTTTDQYGSYNLGYSNAEVDKLTEEAMATTNQSERKTKLQSAMKIAMDDVAIIPLYQFKMHYALANDILWEPRLDGAIKAYEMAGKK